jgi:hypothetical protein
MKFYYENSMGDYGVFSEKNIVKAIYIAWNIEANLYLVSDNIKKLTEDNFNKNTKLIFAPWEDNKLNSAFLSEFGYYMTDGEHSREIRDIATDKVIKYDWAELRKLI